MFVGYCHARTICAFIVVVQCYVVPRTFLCVVYVVPKTFHERVLIVLETNILGSLMNAIPFKAAVGAVSNVDYEHMWRTCRGMKETNPPDSGERRVGSDDKVEVEDIQKTSFIDGG